MIDICFVCTEDTCRSVMAERIARKMAADRKLDYTFTSAGLFATGENISENAKLALKQLGYDYSDRKSVKLSKIKPKTLYVCVTKIHADMIKGGKVISFSSLAGDVVDPYGQPLDTYIKAAKQIEKNVELLLNRIEKLRSEI